MSKHRNPGIRGRRYNGSPHLKLRNPKTLAKTFVRQRLKEVVALAAAELHPTAKTSL